MKIRSVVHTKVPVGMKVTYKEGEVGSVSELVGCEVKKVCNINLEERWLSERPNSMYVGYDRNGSVLLTIPAEGCIVDYVYV